MDNFWTNFAFEIGIFSFFGVLYYFYQKRKIIKYEQNKMPMVMSFLLEACLIEKKEISQPKLDTLIESLDDYLKQKSPTPPLALLRSFEQSAECPEDLKQAIREGLKELGD